MELTEKEQIELKKLLSDLRALNMPLKEFLLRHNHDDYNSSLINKLNIVDNEGLVLKTGIKSVELGRGLKLKNYLDGLPNLGDNDVGTIYYNTTYDEVWAYRKAGASNEWKALMWVDGVTGAIVADSSSYDADEIPKYTDDDDATVDQANYAKLKEYTWNEASGSILAVFRIISASSGDAITCRFYKNGIAVGAEVSVSSDIPAFSDEVISVANGDKIQVYGKRTSGSANNAKIDFVKLYYNKCLTLTAPTKETI